MVDTVAEAAAPGTTAYSKSAPSAILVCCFLFPWLIREFCIAISVPSGEQPQGVALNIWRNGVVTTRPSGRGGSVPVNAFSENSFACSVAHIVVAKITISCRLLERGFCTFERIKRRGAWKYAGISGKYHLGRKTPRPFCPSVDEALRGGLRLGVRKESQQDQKCDRLNEETQRAWGHGHLLWGWRSVGSVNAIAQRAKNPLGGF